MTLALDNSDLETFSEYFGFSGIDADLFYEIYYQLDSDSWDIEDNWISYEEA